MCRSSGCWGSHTNPKIMSESEQTKQGGSVREDFICVNFRLDSLEK